MRTPSRAAVTLLLIAALAGCAPAPAPVPSAPAMVGAAEDAVAGNADGLAHVDVPGTGPVVLDPGAPLPAEVTDHLEGLTVAPPPVAPPADADPHAEKRLAAADVTAATGRHPVWVALRGTYDPSGALTGTHFVLELGGSDAAQRYADDVAAGDAPGVFEDKGDAESYLAGLVARTADPSAYDVLAAES